jgi:hypothetical protein
MLENNSAKFNPTKYNYGLSRHTLFAMTSAMQCHCLALTTDTTDSSSLGMWYGLIGTLLTQLPTPHSFEILILFSKLSVA